MITQFENLVLRFIVLILKYNLNGFNKVKLQEHSSELIDDIYQYTKLGGK
jgi:hypothetical protein